MNAEWQVTAWYNTATVAVLGLFTFEDDARAFAASARRRWVGAKITVRAVAVSVELPQPEPAAL